MQLCSTCEVFYNCMIKHLLPLDATECKAYQRDRELVEEELREAKDKIEYLESEIIKLKEKDKK